MRSEEELKIRIATKLIYIKYFLLYVKLMTDFEGSKVSEVKRQRKSI